MCHALTIVSTMRSRKLYASPMHAALRRAALSMLLSQANALPFQHTSSSSPSTATMRLMNTSSSMKEDAPTPLAGWKMMTSPGVGALRMHSARKGLSSARLLDCRPALSPSCNSYCVSCCLGLTYGCFDKAGRFFFKCSEREGQWLLLYEQGNKYQQVWQGKGRWLLLCVVRQSATGMTREGLDQSEAVGLC